MNEDDYYVLLNNSISADVEEQKQALAALIELSINNEEFFKKMWNIVTTAPRVEVFLLNYY
jgi:hypothetical protein